MLLFDCKFSAFFHTGGNLLFSDVELPFVIAQYKKSASFHNEAALLGKKYHIAAKLKTLFEMYK